MNAIFTMVMLSLAIRMRWLTNAYTGRYLNNYIRGEIKGDILKRVITKMFRKLHIIAAPKRNPGDLVSSWYLVFFILLKYKNGLYQSSQQGQYQMLSWRKYKGVSFNQNIRYLPL